jgi:hypothetical protein
VGYDMSGGEMGILFGIGVMYVVCFWLITLLASAPPPPARPLAAVASVGVISVLVRRNP